LIILVLVLIFITKITLVTGEEKYISMVSATFPCRGGGTPAYPIFLRPTCAHTRSNNQILHCRPRMLTRDLLTVANFLFIMSVIFSNCDVHFISAQLMTARPIGLLCGRTCRQS